MLTMMMGQPGFFSPHQHSPWFSLRGAKIAASFYDNSPLRETWLRLVDLDRIKSPTMRCAAGAVNVLNGNFSYFDNAQLEMQPEHVMASGALPPALPMVQIRTDYFWDGGLVSNTPLQHLLDNIACTHMLVFQVDLFIARGILPRDMHDVFTRQKDIQYSSRTRLVTEYYMNKNTLNTVIRRLRDKIPEAQLTEEERALQRKPATLPEVTILQLICQQTAYEGQAKDYEFSGTSMQEQWESGYRDTQRSLIHGEWLKLPSPTGSVTVRCPSCRAAIQVSPSESHVGAE
jgi:NTE family protein